jgi:hypothetical protein
MPEVAESNADISQGLRNLYGPGQVWLEMKSQEAHKSGVRNCLGVSVEVRCRVLPTGVETHRLTLVYCRV